MVLLISTSLFAQEKVTANTVITNDQSSELMIKIAADPEMRIIMMNMMIGETKGNNEEMVKLVNTMYLDPEMRKIITAKNTGKSDDKSFTIEPLGTMKDDTKSENEDPMTRKKHKFQKN
jgi:hypothetical protein